MKKPTGLGFGLASPLKTVCLKGIELELQLQRGSMGTRCAHRDTGSQSGSRAAERRTSSQAPVARGSTRVAHGHRLPTATARPVGTATAQL